MRRVFLAFSAVSGALAFIACASDDAPSVFVAPSTDGGGLDARLGNEAGAPAGDADPGPGDVCGDTTGLQSGPWPLAGGCPTRAGHSTEHSPSTTAVKTIMPLAGGPGSAAIGSDGTLWIGALDGTVYHVNAGGGLLQQITLPGPVKSTPALDEDGNAFVACEDGYLYSLDAEPVDAGADVDAAAPKLANVRYKVQIGKSDSSPVIGADHTIYVGTNDGNLHALLPSGLAATEKWRAATGDTLGASPAIGQSGAIYVGSTDHAVHAFLPDGSVAWTLDVGAEIHASVSVGGDGTIYAGTADGKLHAIAPNGVEKWAFSGAGGAFVGTPAVYGGQVCAANEDKQLYAISTTDGTQRWTYATLGTPSSPVIDADDHLDFGSSDSHVYVVSDKGTLVIAGTARGPVVGGTALGRQGIFVVTDTGLEAMGP